MSKLSEAQREALSKLARAWAAAQPEPWDSIRPQTREALRRAGLADGCILPAGLMALHVDGTATRVWAMQLQAAAQTSRARDGHLQAWWRAIPRHHLHTGAVPVLTVADLRAAADGLAPLEAAHVAATAEAERLQDLARAEVRAALRVDRG